jgi:hypothetical protein
MSDGTEHDLKIRMSDKEIALLTECVQKSRFYLEFGAGGSTEFAIRDRSRFVVSIESDKEWIDKIRTKDNIRKAEAEGILFIEHIDLGPVGVWGAPAGTDQIRNWPKYFMAPFSKYDFCYDFVLIDGRFRASCAFAAYPFVGDDALIAVHDYVNRHWFSDIEKFYDIVDIADTLCVFRKRARINHRSLYMAIMNSIFDYR